MIAKQLLGLTGHASTRIIFGAYALSKATQAEADRILELLLEYGVNHIDTATRYGNAEKCIGPWMEQHRSDFFIATKTRSRTYQGAWDDLQRSLARMRVDYGSLANARSDQSGGLGKSDARGGHIGSLRRGP